ncbi:TlpA family protein disulfide reductase [Robiginitalea aurantiaca]|uniref:Transaldolase n=1 Tax=Robiginitalea aurantiaca TaxID=3056915 RepID=A0ABT7WG74_9FLAO|nr:transaldolase [Robiginitalea aurantiaca]MDM9631916.1 transaldolase [Robiginitalea aurantiaca]
MIRFLSLLILVGVWGCQEAVEDSNPVYISGEIVNPTDPYVILFKGEEPLDSALLDAQNRFVLRIDSLENGLYNFFHRPEFQYIYLEQGDSIQVRLNTVAFDESLVFSGSGEGVNNFLIDFFLESEGEENLIREMFIPMEPSAFSVKLDSLKARKLRQLDELKTEFPITEGAYHTAKASILYKNYYYKEKYPFWHRKLTGDAKGVHELPEDFYAYRSEVTYDDPSLTFLKPYHDFMIFHIGNLAYMGCKKACEISSDNKVGNQLHFNQHQLQLIDSLVTGDELRDNLFRTVAFDYLLKYDSQENLDQFMSDFHKRSENNRHNQEIDALSEAIRKLSTDEVMPDLTVEDAAGKVHSLRDIAGAGPVVFYFWSGPQQHHLANITRRIGSLKEEYKEYRFVGICLRTEKARWNSMVSTYGLNAEDQYWAEDFEDFAHTLVVYHPYKSIVARNGKIVNGFANLNTSF